MKKVKRDVRGQNRKTQNNKLRCAEILCEIFDTFTPITTLDELKPTTEDGEEQLLDWLEEGFQDAMDARMFGKVKSTVLNRFGNIIRILKILGANKWAVDKLRMMQTEMMDNSGISTTDEHVEYIPSLEDVQTIMLKCQPIMNGAEKLVHKDVPLTEERGLQGALFTIIAVAYSVRASTIEAIEWKHINKSTITLFIKKKRGHNPEPIVRDLHDPVKEALDIWRQKCTDLEGNIWKNKTDPAKFASSILRQCGIPEKNGRVGVHCFRKAFATYCYSNGIPMEHAAAALGHKDSKVTERVYVGLSAKQQMGNKALNQYFTAFTGLAESLKQMKKTFTTFSKALGKHIIWSQKDETHFLNADKYPSLAFMLKHGVDPSEAAVYTIDKGIQTPVQIRTDPPDYLNPSLHSVCKESLHRG